MKKSLRLFTLLLALLCAVTVFAGCQKTPGNTGTPTEPPAANNTKDPTTDTAEPGPELDENGYQVDTLPDEMDYDNATIKILVRQENQEDLFPKAYIKDNEVNNVVYRRQQNVQDRMNVKLEIVRDVPGSWQAQDTWLAQARLCGEQEIDIVATFSLWPGVMAQEGLLCNLNNLTYPNQEMPWWPSSVSEWTQSGALYFISSNSSVCCFNSMEVMYCNEQMFLAREGMESPIELAARGDWYIETMLEYVAEFESDLEPDDPSRIYGLTVDDHSRMDAFYYSSGFDSLKNEDGEAVVQVHKYEVIDRVVKFIDQMAPIFEVGAATMEHDTINLMKDKRTALMVASLGRIRGLNDLDYAPIPLPKLDSSQKEYRIIQDNGYDVWGITANAKDPEMCGVFIEAIASADYRLTAPYYFDTYIKMKYSREEINKIMFETIRSSVIYDLGRAMQVSIGVATEGAWRNAFYDYKNNTVLADIDGGSFSTYVAGRSEKTEQQLEDMLANFRKYVNLGKSTNNE